MSKLRLVSNKKPIKSNPIELAFEANELYVHIASKITDSPFKDKMLKHVVDERLALVMEVANQFKEPNGQ